MHRPSRQKVLIHAGTPKTGSSYLQRKLLANRHHLELAGFQYFTLDEPNNRKLTRRIQVCDSIPQITCEFEAYLSESSPEHTIILSDEVLGTAGKLIVEGIAASERYEVSAAVFFIRSPASFAESSYLQWHFVEEPDFERFLQSWKHPRWDRRLQHWSGAGVEVIPLPYVPREQDVVDQFCRAIGLPAECLREDLDRNDVWGANPSYNRKGLRIAQALYQRLGAQSGELKMTLLRHGPDLFTQSFGAFTLFDRKSAEAYNRKYEVMLKRIENVYGVAMVEPLAGHDRTASYDEDEPTAEELYQATLRVLSSIMET